MIEDPTDCSLKAELFIRDAVVRLICWCTSIAVLHSELTALSVEPISSIWLAWARLVLLVAIALFLFTVGIVVVACPFDLIRFYGIRCNNCGQHPLAKNVFWLGSVCRCKT
jgi:hypothetical protein